MTEFNHLKASQVLAYGKLFKKSVACKLYDVKSCTYDQWKNRLKHRKDEKLQIMYEEALAKMVEKWEEENDRALTEGLKMMQIGFKNHPFNKEPRSASEKRNWGYTIECAGKAIKSMGDLAIGSKVLSEEDDELDSDQ